MCIRDSARALRDESRQYIAALQARYIEETGVRSLKVKHNNVLGYFIEVPEAQGKSLLGSYAGFTHRQTMANAMRFATVELADLEARIVEAGSTALKLELEAFDHLRAAVLARLVTQGAGIVQRLDRPICDEAAIALLQRQLVGQKGAEKLLQLGRHGGDGAEGRGQLGRQHCACHQVA